MPRNNHFQFKQFRIIQEHSAMKVGMDGVLLGAWVDPFGAETILDIGTGTGLIALMVAQRNDSALIDAIEIDPEAFEEAKMNFQESAWSNRIRIECCSFQDFAEQTDRKYDLIVSNPPFFAKDGLKAPAQNRAQARHSDSLPLKFLISGAANILTETGRIALIMPVESLPEILQLCLSNKLYISRLCRIKPNPIKPDFRILFELTQTDCIAIEERLIIEFETHHDYTPEYKELTRDFYLKF
jgi:tRNA1Val (adenine37-N6)-methyltransferase